MRMGVPARSVNCFDGCGFRVFASRALGMGAMRVPRPAAGIMTITFMAGCKYTRGGAGSSNSPDSRQLLNFTTTTTKDTKSHEGSHHKSIPFVILRALCGP